MKLHSYKIRVLKNATTKKYIGEVAVNGTKEIETIPMASELNAIRALNHRINEFNTLRAVNLPQLREIKNVPPIVFNDVLERIENEPAKATESNIMEATKITPKAKAPKRKPFTPYGLNGYFVDKNGNIRLLLDRKASSKTVTLDPEFFAQLTEMVKLTQQQQGVNNAGC